MSAKPAAKTRTMVQKGESGFEPKIVAYLCSWCSYTGADTAGIARLKSPANLRAIRVPCSGRVSPELIMRTFDQGADGVIVLACHIGECHYDSGNHRTAKRLPVLQSLMSFTGLEPERLRLDYVSASEGERFARVTTEFTEAVRALGPARWRQASGGWGSARRSGSIPELVVSKPASPAQSPVLCPPERCQEYTKDIQEEARRLLSNRQVSCIIGYEKGPRGQTRPAFISNPMDVERLVWNQACTHNLAVYIHHRLSLGASDEKEGIPNRVAVVAKPCDTRAINVLLAEKRFSREQIHIIGVACDGVYTQNGSGSPASAGPVTPLDKAYQSQLQNRCVSCSERRPVVYDTLIGEPSKAIHPPAGVQNAVAARADALIEMSPTERQEYWLSQFDRCILCFACRQACPMCDCPTCLYERDDSLWTGIGQGLSEKRTFHLGRAYHLAGRCVGCDECERACPMDIPISLLNLHLAREMQERFGHRAGLEPAPSPFLTVLDREEV